MHSWVILATSISFYCWYPYPIMFTHHIYPRFLICLRFIVGYFLLFLPICYNTFPLEMLLVSSFSRRKSSTIQILRTLCACDNSFYKNQILAIVFLLLFFLKYFLTYLLFFLMVQLAAILDSTKQAFAPYNNYCYRRSLNSQPIFLCPRRDSNSHDLQDHKALDLARLPSYATRAISSLLDHRKIYSNH